MNYPSRVPSNTVPIVLAAEDAAQAARLLALFLEPQPPLSRGAIMHLDQCAELALEIHSARRARDQFFPSEMFADPAWDILLILYWSDYAQQRMSISSVCAASGVPSTTALRWIETLRSAGLVLKTRHPTDARVQWIGLTADANAKLDQYFNGLLDTRASPPIKRAA